jgi:bifunctional NMN adenylyltransferase/nudix hydrolase
VRFRINEAIAVHGIANPQICLTGYEKDASSFYLRLFPEWHNDLADKALAYSATDIREFFYKRALALKNAYLPADLAHIVELDTSPDYLRPDMIFGNDIGLSSNSGLLSHDLLQDRLFDLAEAWDFDKKYDPKEYPVIVVTVDAVTVCNGHILLVQRKNNPGKGKWALPGGHLNEDERMKDAMLRELREETRINISNRILRRSIVDDAIFDHPRRSARARVITNAYLISLENEEKLPSVKGSDDAERAAWFPLGELRKHTMFEDHYDIAMKMTGSL